MKQDRDAEKRYMAAVNGRKKFRAAFREERSKRNGAEAERDRYREALEHVRDETGCDAWPGQACGCLHCVASRALGLE